MSRRGATAREGLWAPLLLGVWRSRLVRASSLWVGLRWSAWSVESWSESELELLFESEH